ncbi:MAG TPA: DNA replication/repair protein RecF [Sphingomicrobium sp.]|nr:DNA replication/repair protein RecF [Sphingomicrobium sp.]
MAAVARLTLTDFRSYTAASLAAGSGFVLLFGENGAGKTNLLEAVSMLAPGRGLRGAALSDMARRGAAGGWAVAAKLGDTDLGTGTQPNAPERRQVRINGAPASVNSLGEWLSILWLTPAMDRLFTGSAGERRRFLDRLVLALEPAHAHHATRYDAAMRARNKLLAEKRWDEAWLDSLEFAMAEHGTAIAAARERTIEGLEKALANAPEDQFARASVAVDGWQGGDLSGSLRENRSRDSAAARATEGPHRQDLAVVHRAKQMPAASSSTGEQKALLLGLVLAHAELVAERRGEPPILLLDEVAAHLDPKRRAALFGRLEGRGQVWMTATEASLFDGIGEASRFHIAPGSVSIA